MGAMYLGQFVDCPYLTAVRAVVAGERHAVLRRPAGPSHISSTWGLVRLGWP